MSNCGLTGLVYVCGRHEESQGGRWNWLLLGFVGVPMGYLGFLGIADALRERDVYPGWLGLVVIYSALLLMWWGFLAGALAVLVVPGRYSRWRCILSGLPKAALVIVVMGLVLALAQLLLHVSERTPGPVGQGTAPPARRIVIRALPGDEARSVPELDQVFAQRPGGLLRADLMIEEGAGMTRLWPGKLRVERGWIKFLSNEGHVRCMPDGMLAIRTTLGEGAEEKHLIGNIAIEVLPVGGRCWGYLVVTPEPKGGTRYDGSVRQLMSSPSGLARLRVRRSEDFRGEVTGWMAQELRGALGGRPRSEHAINNSER